MFSQRSNLTHPKHQSSLRQQLEVLACISAGIQIDPPSKSSRTVSVPAVITSKKKIWSTHDNSCVICRKHDRRQDRSKREKRHTHERETHTWERTVWNRPDIPDYNGPYPLYRVKCSMRCAVPTTYNSLSYLLRTEVDFCDIFEFLRDYVTFKIVLISGVTHISLRSSRPERNRFER